MTEPPSRQIEGLPAPLSELPWSGDFVMQSIEVLLVALRDRSIVVHLPEHADSFVVGWPARAKPEQIASGAIEQLGLRPVVLHSTSWRHAEAEVVLTYLSVVEPASEPPSGWTTRPVARAELARGDTTAPPVAIAVGQVLEHALRHLAWLLRDDPAIAAALPEWSVPLEAYVPEPFRSFGAPDARAR